MLNGAINITVKVIKVANNIELIIEIKKNVVSPTLLDLSASVATTSEVFLFKCKW